ncbi:MAG TPA: histidine phosphatase family protein, partial [Acidimicrobiales bacterium]|nr:histidine phosphatase family protein [Acidimicrobiales bacterium]
MTRLVLIRHGESVAQVEGFVSGHDTCRGLSPLGRRQVEALRDRLSRTGEIHADVLLTSLLPRAIETAEIVSPAIGGLEPIPDCDLCEMHFGSAEGTRWEDGTLQGWGPHMEAPEGGESWAAFEARVAGALRRYAEAHAGQTIVAAVHGGVIGHAWRALLGIDEVPAADIRNASITEWVHGRPPYGDG